MKNNKRFILAKGYPFSNMDNNLVYLLQVPWDNNSKVKIQWHTGIRPSIKYKLILEEVKDKHYQRQSPRV